MLGAVIWGAATLSSNLKNLTDAVQKLTRAVEKLDDKVDDHEVAITNHASRFRRIEDQLRELTASP